jgi:hypothetical protein
VRHSISHLEVLHPALSERNKTRAWFLDRLGANLEKQLGVMRLRSLAGDLDLKPKVVSRIERLAEVRCRRLAGQTAKLVAGAFQDSDEEFIRAIAGDVKKLGLQEITLLPIEGVKKMKRSRRWIVSGSLSGLVRLPRLLVLAGLLIGTACGASAAIADDYSAQWGPQIGSQLPVLEAYDQTGTLRNLDNLSGEQGLLLVLSRSADW